ncbi:c-type cytochrome biogenesis protein CcsB [Modestobacter marinus]|uniref:C-type cytochrome biogenesis protein CcsB n=1 Tax=Modestobacter marinus TaxID=477641 RepID=A0A846LV03_9ACTN|nr:c-type cytochrome biogenesis protein CcsB [Modestobacter marinus]NIH69308.1 cytochrome c-type biogenesis protein CcsB [Modestobacter marinus]GGL83192.1 c-type cytochrome biogenesis protein CcsB [Modestobacter marinus]
MGTETFAELSDTLFGVAVAVYALAALGFAAELAFGRPSIRSRAERAEVRAGGASPLPPPSSGVVPVGPRSARCGRVGVALTLVGALAQAGVLIGRSVAAGRVPWGNMYEFATAAVLVGVVAYLVLAMRMPALRRIGVFVLGPTVIALVLIGLYLYAESGPLVAALRSNWLVVHVSAAILSFGVFIVSGVASALYLVAVRRERSSLTTGSRSAGWADRLPSAATMDQVAHRTAIFGFPIWTFAVIAGAIWAESAWGRFWGWDPKETWAFISWALYAAYLHARTTAGWRGRPAAWTNLVALASLVFNLLFVNLVSTGLHSYGGVS